MADKKKADSRENDDCDLLCGASEIAQFLFGDSAERRRVYHLASPSATADRLPIIRLGKTLNARRSTLILWLAAKEGGKLPTNVGGTSSSRLPAKKNSEE
jgi:hypothetical protein